MERKDAFGTQIQPGDTIAFAVRRGSSMWMNKLVIESITDKGVRGFDPEDVRMKFKSLTNMTTTVVIEKGEVIADQLGSDTGESLTIVAGAGGAA